MGIKNPQGTVPVENFKGRGKLEIVKSIVFNYFLII